MSLSECASTLGPLAVQVRWRTATWRLFAVKRSKRCSLTASNSSTWLLDTPRPTKVKEIELHRVEMVLFLPYIIEEKSILENWKKVFYFPFFINQFNIFTFLIVDWTKQLCHYHSKASSWDCDDHFVTFIRLNNWREMSVGDPGTQIKVTLMAVVILVF